MYETEELWRAKKGGGPGRGASGLYWWLLRSALVLAAGIAVMVWLFGRNEGVIPLAEPPAAAMTAVPDEAAARGAEEGIERELEIRRNANGHFLLKVDVNGVPLPFLVDTGASDIALTPEAAAKLGLEPAPADFNRVYKTANGEILAAPVTLRDVRVKELRLYDLEASIIQAPMQVSLLGMSFLERLSSYEVRGDRLLLRW